MFVTTHEKGRVPKFRHHKASGQGYVCIDGRAIYLGPHDTPETLEKYHQFIAEWIAAGRHLPVSPEQLTINELLARCWSHAATYHRKPNGEVSLCVDQLLRLTQITSGLVKYDNQYDDTPARMTRTNGANG